MMEKHEVPFIPFLKHTHQFHGRSLNTQFSANVCLLLGKENSTITFITKQIFTMIGFTDSFFITYKIVNQIVYIKTSITIK